MAVLAFEIVYTVTDEKEKESQMSIFVPVTFTLLDYLETARGIADFVDNVMTGKFANFAELCVGVDLSGLTGNTADANSDVEEIGQITVDTDVSGLYGTINIPGWDESNNLAGTNIINQADTEVATLLTLLENGDGTVEPVDVGEVQLLDTVKAEEVFRNSGKAR